MTSSSIIENRDMNFQGRDEMFLEGLDDFVDELEQKHARHIKNLEQNLQDEKQRLAVLEKTIMETKNRSSLKSINAPQALVDKQTKVLGGMMEVFKKMTCREIEAKQEWDDQWREKFSDIRQQHHEMEFALKTKHICEMKEMKEVIHNEVRILAQKFQASKDIPSPRSMRRIQDKNMQRVVGLFHKHARERMYLASKISQQEEFLIRAKSQSLQDKMLQSQLKSKKLYEHLKKFSEKQADLHVSHGPDTTKPSRYLGFTNTAESSLSRLDTHDSSHVPSPRFISSTFYTEVEDGHVGEGHEEDYAGWIQKPKFATRPERNAEIPNTWAGQMSTSSRDSNSDMNKLGTSLPPVRKSLSFPGSEAFSADMAGSINDQSDSRNEFPAWAQPKLDTILKSEGKPIWNTSACKWNPNVIAIESSVMTASKAPTSSPYATFAVGERPGDRPSVSKGASSSGRRSRKSAAADRDHGRSGSTRSLSRPRLGLGATRHTAGGGASTAPERSRNATRGKVSLPSISSQRGDRLQSTDQNFNRPKLGAGGGEEFPNAAEKYSKLESWIEDKIRLVLGADSSKAAILAHRPPAAGSIHGAREGTGVAGSAGVAWAGGSTEQVRGGSSRGARDADLDAFGEIVDDRPSSGADSRGPSRGSGRPGSGSYSSSAGRTSTAAVSGDVGGFLGRMRSQLSGLGQDAAMGNEGLRLESQGLGQPGVRTVAQVLAALNPATAAAAQERREIAQADDGAGPEAETAAGGDEGAEVMERRAQFERVSSSLRVRDGGGRGGAAAATGAGVGPRQAKTPKRVGWNLSPRESDAGAGDDGGSERMDTVRSSTSGYDSSRPVTQGSSRPGTDASGSFIGEDDDSDEARAAERPEEEEGFSEAEVKEFFSKVRHNKVAECEEALARGFPVDTRDRHGNTPLLVAAQNGHKRLVKMLLRANSDVNATNQQGNTALHFTMSYGYQSLANYLQSKGADDTIMNTKGLTCYDGIG